MPLLAREIKNQTEKKKKYFQFQHWSTQKMHLKDNIYIMLITLYAHKHTFLAEPFCSNWAAASFFGLMSGSDWIEVYNGWDEYHVSFMTGVG